jgi:hypothetical protein
VRCILTQPTIGRPGAQIIMQSPLRFQSIADTVSASSPGPCPPSPDRYCAAAPEAGVLSARQYPDGEHYREIAGKLREVARQCRFPGARRELLHLAVNYERRGDYIDRRSN